MKAAVGILAPLLLTGFLYGSVGAAKPVRSTAFVDVTIVQGRQEPMHTHQTVVVSGSRIVAMGALQDVVVAADATIIDGRHRYLIPGLIDVHVHLWGYSRTGEGDPDTERAVLNMLLANGITTAVIMEGSPASLALRRAVADGSVTGPRLFTAGPLIQEENSGAPPHRQTFTTVEEVTAEVVREKAAGYDFVKVHGALSAESYAALLATARAVGLPVIGHVPDNLGLDAALDGGQVQITHIESYLQSYFEFNRKLPTDAAEIDSMVRIVSDKTKRAGVYVAPTLSVFHQIIAQIADVNALLGRPAMRYMPPAALADWRPPSNPYVQHWTVNDIPRLRAQFSVMQKIAKSLQDAGVPLLAGTDDLVPCQLPGFSMQDEFEQLSTAGLTPREILQSATVNAARFLNRPDVSGVIQVGNTADLVLLNANPLVDVDNVFRQEGVMLRGQWYTESELMQRLDSDERNYR